MTNVAIKRVVVSMGSATFVGSAVQLFSVHRYWLMASNHRSVESINGVDSF